MQTLFLVRGLPGVGKSTLGRSLGRTFAADDYFTRADGTWRITPGPPPTRWFLQTPERAAAGRAARPAPSITALLSALRAALGLPRGTPARIGPAA